MHITNDDIDAISKLVEDLCGIYLDHSKGYLISNRLMQLATRLGCSSYRELAIRASSASATQLQTEIIDAITTNETLFFRDNSPFEALKHKVIPELIDSKAHTAFPRRLRIWSAACSTGQEPYSIAMTLRDLIPNVHAWDVSILATDISEHAIKTASAGVYSPHEIQRGMQSHLLTKHFNPLGQNWKVKDEVRSLVSFRRLNLLQRFSNLGPFDVIFCRNVAIYFKSHDRNDLFRRLAAALTPEGYLFTGSSESLSDLGPEFAPLHHCRATVYQPNKRRVLAPI